MAKKIKEITLEELDADKFINEKTEEISDLVGDGIAINTLSGGVDSSVVTMLGHAALGSRLKTYFIDNGLMRTGEPRIIADSFVGRGVDVVIYHAQTIFFDSLKGLTDPEEKREAITNSFYRLVFGPIVKESRAKYVLQGTIWTDVYETVDLRLKRQHNVFPYNGIDTQAEYGYKLIEPLVQLKKPAVRKIACALGLPKEVYNRMPFPGPALAARVIGEATPERIHVVRIATAIVEDELKDLGAFQYMAILHNDRVTGMKNGARDYGHQVEIRCWNTKDAITATPTRLPWKTLEKLAGRITAEVPGVVSVTYGIAPKPPSTMEVV